MALMRLPVAAGAVLMVPPIASIGRAQEALLTMLPAFADTGVEVRFLAAGLRQAGALGTLVVQLM